MTKKAKWMGNPWNFRDEIDSTNDWAKRVRSILLTVRQKEREESEESGKIPREAVLPCLFC